MYHDLHSGCNKIDRYTDVDDPWDWELCYQCIYPCRDLVIDRAQKMNPIS